MSTQMQKSTQEQLKRLITQIERLEEEKAGIAEDVRDKFLEAKAVGFDIKIMRQVLKLRKKSKSDRDEEEAVLETYLHALGMLSEAMGDTPMGEWAREEASKVDVHKIARAHGMSKEVAEMVLDDEMAKAAKSLRKLADDDETGISVQFGDGPEIPLNKRARDRIEAAG